MVLEARIGVVVGGAVEDRAVKVFAGTVEGLAAEDSADVDGATEDGAVECFVAEDTAVKGAFEVDGAGIVCRGFTC